MRYVFLAILVMGLAFCQQYSNGILLTNESSSMERNGFIPYENDYLGISISYPINWQFVQQTNSIIFSPSIDGPLGPHLIVQPRNSDPNETLDHYLNNFFIVPDREDFQNFRIINSSTDASLGGLPAYLVYFSYTEPYMDTYSTRKQLEIGTIIDSNKVYSISFDAAINDYSTYLPQVEQMIQSFKILCR